MKITSCSYFTFPKSCQGWRKISGSELSWLRHEIMNHTNELNLATNSSSWNLNPVGFSTEMSLLHLGAKKILSNNDEEEKPKKNKDGSFLVHFKIPYIVTPVDSKKPKTKKFHHKKVKKVHPLKKFHHRTHRHHHHHHHHHHPPALDTNSLAAPAPSPPSPPQAPGRCGKQEITPLGCFSGRLLFRVSIQQEIKYKKCSRKHIMSLTRCGQTNFRYFYRCLLLPISPYVR